MLLLLGSFFVCVKGYFCIILIKIYLILIKILMDCCINWYYMIVCIYIKVFLFVGFIVWWMMKINIKNNKNVIDKVWIGWI